MKDRRSTGRQQSARHASRARSSVGRIRQRKGFVVQATDAASRINDELHGGHPQRGRSTSRPRDRPFAKRPVMNVRMSHVLIASSTKDSVRPSSFILWSKCTNRASREVFDDKRNAATNCESVRCGVLRIEKAERGGLSAIPRFCSDARGLRTNFGAKTWGKHTYHALVLFIGSFFDCEVMNLKFAPTVHQRCTTIQPAVRRTEFGAETSVSLRSWSSRKSPSDFARSRMALSNGMTDS